MIGIPVLVAVGESAVLLMGIWVILFWLWPAVRLDCFRQQLFMVRDELFDYAASGKISFTHPAYRLLRKSMNGFIRYGHQISFFQFVMTWLTWKSIEGRNSFSWEKEWREALRSLDDETRKDLLVFHQRSRTYVSQRIVFGSPLLMVALVIAAIAFVIHAGWKSVREVLSAALSETAARVLDQRILDEEAARAAA